ncbi:MAG TPA: AMP-binding protein [Chloroflexota bacterium]|nr:AMP-binding protein [Chloroflexota bacterium]
MAALQDVVTSDSARQAYKRDGFWDDSTLAGRVRELANRQPDAVAVVDDGGARKTYAQLNRDSDTLASHFKAHGIQAGEVISVQLPNRYETVVVALAIFKCGAVINTLLPGYRKKELAHVFQTASPRAIVTPVEYRGFAYAPMVRELEAETHHDIWHLQLGGSLDELLAAPHPSGPPTHAIDAAAVSELIFTSGTEASPKAIMHTEQTANFSARVAYEDMRLTPNDVVWMPSPVGHSTGFNYGLRVALYNGLELVLQDVWNAKTAATLVQQEGCTYTLAATTFLKDLVEEANRQHLNLSSMQCFGCGGAPVPPDLVEAALECGIQVLRLYGSTEVLVGTWNRKGDPLDKRKFTDGVAMSHVEVELRDDDGRKVAPGAEGEIYTRGPNTCVGFFRDPDRTAATFQDGWVKSGDLAVMDEDGYITIVGRKKEIIIRGGMNITPREIEDMLLQFPEVYKAAVVGMPDDRLGERGCACVVVREGASLDFSTMIDRLTTAGLAAYKLPERLEVLRDFPSTASGKIQKHEIIRQLVEAGPPRWDR